MSMTLEPEIHRRKSLRLKAYDYSQSGLYFVTICIQQRRCLFGSISLKNKLVLNDAGRMVIKQWEAIMTRFPTVRLQEYIVMPNHFYGIFELTVGAPLVGAQNDGRLKIGQPQGIAPTVSSIIGAFKSLSTNEYILGVKQNNWPPFSGRLWQRNYYEHVIRDENAYLKLSEYIQSNPAKWLEDKYYV